MKNQSKNCQHKYWEAEKGLKTLTRISRHRKQLGQIFDTNTNAKSIAENQVPRFQKGKQKFFETLGRRVTKKCKKTLVDAETLAEQHTNLQRQKKHSRHTSRRKKCTQFS